MIKAPFGGFYFLSALNNQVYIDFVAASTAAMM
jgi:hypothetical protein